MSADEFNKMSLNSDITFKRLNSIDTIECIENMAIDCINGQSKALLNLAKNVPKGFTPLVQYILKLEGRVILVGMGKSGYIANKIAASLASTGTPAFYLHPAEASHGDLGMVTQKDMVLMISNSGETRELFDTINYCKNYDIKIAAITMRPDSTLGSNADFLLDLPSCSEMSALSAPTTSALMTLCLGDTLQTILHEAKGFTKEDFKVFHPGGKIGSDLMKVKDLMHTGNDIPTISESAKFTDLIIIMSSKCLGCALVLDDIENSLIGIITNDHLKTHIEEISTNKLAKSIMNDSFKTINEKALASEALTIMRKEEVSILPVVIDENKVIGIIHINDILKAGIN